MFPIPKDAHHRKAGQSLWTSVFYFRSLSVNQGTLGSQAAEARTLDVHNLFSPLPTVGLAQCFVDPGHSDLAGVVGQQPGLVSAQGRT